jgi:ATP-dependent RNA helicase RhlE
MSDWRFLPRPLAAVPARLGFEKPTAVQAECLPDALAGESFLAVAPTGTGKTFVYLLPLWSRLPARHGNLILVPTRELGYQVSQMLQQIDPRSRDGLVLCLGGHDVDSQRKRLAAEWHTLVATPGRLLDLLSTDPGLLRSIRFLVLDEFDRLIDMGFEEQVGGILAKVPKKRQTMLFSATGAEDALGRLPLTDLARHEVLTPKGAALEERFYFLKSNRAKNDLLVEALREAEKKDGPKAKGARGQALVFVANREKANHLNGLLRLRGFTAAALHGDRLQGERATAYQDFKDGRTRVLVATDLAARGLDVARVDLVVNFDLPRNYREYVHRSGRTARRERAGVCLSFAGPDDYLALRNIEREYGAPVPAHPDYAQRERWLEGAKRTHDTKVRIEKRAEFLRKEQGL